jgi:aminopeptidase N
MQRLISTILSALVLSLPLAAPADEFVRHEIKLKLDPAGQRLEVQDTVTLPTRTADPGERRFVLHGGLSPVAITPGAKLIPEAKKLVQPGDVPLEVYRVRLPPGVSRFILSYAGTIRHPLDAQAQEYARGFRETPGTVSPQGVFLSGATHWYPSFDDSRITFDLSAELPAGWEAVSQGSRVQHERDDGATRVTWTSPEPQEEIYLVAAPFTEYDQAVGPNGEIQAMAFLRRPAPALAAKYLEATAQYLALYSQLLAPYPYKKFALVENFWETGYGMPSFTLLGSKVIRLPFILRTSYPHEILHNWWGNGVYVDYRTGNWSEGLTVYLADYLTAENRGKGRDYRMAALQKYSDYVSGGKDFPLTAFRSRHSSSQEAVGYGKGMMMFHMLRRLLGDEDFLKGLRRFYADNLFKVASFDDVRAAFETVTGPGRLAPFFDQWVKRTGAPVLELSGAKVTRDLDGYDLEFTLAQTQEGEPYQLQVPAYVYVQGLDGPRIKVLPMSEKRETYHYFSPVMPARLAIDPEFDVFRRPSPLETPPTLSRLLGASSPLIIVPAGEAGGPWRALARAWAKDQTNLPQVAADTDVPALPDSASYWLFGGENRFAPELEKVLGRYGAAISDDSVTIDNRRFPLAGHTFVFASFNPRTPAFSSTLVLSGNTEKLPLLAAKLPHYGKYSWLVFDDGMSSVASGIWRVSSSPLSVDVPGVPAPAAENYPQREPLARLPSVFSAQRMYGDVKYLASLPGGRGPGSPGLRKAEAMIETAFKEAGLRPFYPSGFAAPFTAGDPASALKLANVLGKIEGTSDRDHYVVLSAHYDHLPANDGKVYPGADDNASGIAMLLELARFYAGHPTKRTIVFAAFSGEEEGRLGSKAFVAGLAAGLAARMNADINFDTVGRLNTGRLFILNSSSSDKWPYIFRNAGYTTGTDYDLVKEDLDSSDQVSFINGGIPGVQFFSGPNTDYHRPTDTSDKIDPRGMVKEAEFAREAVDYLAGNSDLIPRPAGRVPETAHGVERRVSTGLVPDFAFQGTGVRAQSVTPGSPLEQAGVKAGDVVIKVNAAPTDNLKRYSDELKKFAPGQKIRLTYLSGGAEKTVEIELVPR